MQSRGSLAVVALQEDAVVAFSSIVCGCVDSCVFDMNCGESCLSEISSLLLSKPKVE